MKKIILLLILVSGLAFGQKIELKEDKFISEITNGNNSQTEMTFIISNSTINKIIESDDYKNFIKTEKEFITYNIENRNIKDELSVYIYSKINSAVISTTFKLKNSTSFKVDPNSSGSIYFNEKGIVISFPFSAKNDLGNDIIKTSVKSGKEIYFIN